MHISSSNVQMLGNYLYSEKKTATERLNFWDKTSKKDSVEKSSHEITKSKLFTKDRVELSTLEYSHTNSKLYSRSTTNNDENGSNSKLETIKNTLDKILQDSEKLIRELQNYSKNNTKTKDTEEEPEIEDKHYQKLRLIKAILEAFTGKKMDIDFPKLNSGNNLQEIPQNISEIQPNDSAQQNSPKGWGLSYTLEEDFYQTESYSFSAHGTIKTDNNIEINFETTFMVSQSSENHSNLTVKDGDELIDPLIVNLNGSFSTLSNKSYDFDINYDGKMEKIPIVNGGGFLALDTNNNGNIDNGSELFGPSTGNGFEELAKYDTDKNNWIDEKDEIFSKLKIWRKDENGVDTLSSLDDSGIGAIHTGNIGADLSYHSDEKLGKLSGAGIYVKNNGEIGTMSHVDFIAK